MTFERTEDLRLVTELVKRSWDHPEMLCDGADPQRFGMAPHGQCFVGRDAEGGSVALFIGFQQSPICLDLHVCMTPSCRGGEAVRACAAFLIWLRAHTPYRKVIGSIPTYNRPMLIVALGAGMTVMAVNRKSTMRGGALEDQTIVEKFLP